MPDAGVYTFPPAQAYVDEQPDTMGLSLAIPKFMVGQTFERTAEEQAPGP